MRFINSNSMLKVIPVCISTMLFCLSCAKQLTDRNTAQAPPAPLELCAFYNNHAVGIDFQEKIELALDQFIVDHNSSEPILTVKGCDNNTDFQTINFVFDSTVYVDKKKNLAATAGNILGLVALPVGLVASGSEFFIGIYFWPNTKTMMRVNISEDFGNNESPETPWLLKTPGYLNSIEEQNIKQGKGFYRILKVWFRKFEKQYSTEQWKLSQR